MRFRWHRGGLQESLETTQEVQTLDDVARLTPYPLMGRLKCRWYAKDDRIGWDTWMVWDEFGVVGFADGELK